MKLELMTDIKEFERLEKGDLILVKWSDNWVKHNQGAKKVMLYNIYENKNSHKEIICQKRYNHYFNYMRYVDGVSVAEEVYSVVD